MSPHIRSALLVGLALALPVSGCTYSVRRAALVPHQQPIRRSGQPMGANRQEVALGSPVVASAGAPAAPAGSNDGVVLPRWDVTGEWRIRSVFPDFDLGLVWDQGFDAGSRAASEDQPDPDHGDVMGGGFNFQYSRRLSDRFRLGFAGEVLLYSIPYVEYRTCVDELCTSPYTTVGKYRDLIPVVSAGVIPSFKVHPRVALFGGLTLRNHPTIEKGDVEGPQLFEGDDVQAGPLGAVVSAGVEVALGRGVRASGYLYQPVSQDPVAYAPTLGLSVAIPLFRDQPTRASLPVVAER